MEYLRKLNIRLVKGEYKNPIKGQVREPRQLYKVFKSIKDEAQELVIAIFLGKELEVKTYDIVSVGGQSVGFVIPSEIFGRAFVMRSEKIILIHNHPKGDPTPSEADREVMSILRAQAKVMNIVFLDFIIVGDGRYWSMFEEAEGGEYAI